MYQDSTHIVLAGFPNNAESILEGLGLSTTTKLTTCSIEDAVGFLNLEQNEDKSPTSVFINIDSNAGDNDIQTASTLLNSICGASEVIVCIPHDKVHELEPWMADIADIWISPLDNEELSFRFKKWLNRHKSALDAWENAQFLEVTINSIPSLVWYKSKDGIHEKVNDSFCAVVQKEKDDVQGKRHAYIWNVEQDDPACIASEEKVMRMQQTYVSEEVVQTEDGQRLLTTYKSPLYDIDGSVMGTVGVAIDVTQERDFEQSLLQKTETLETIFTSLDCGIITHSLDGSKLYGINQAALNILGYSSEEEMMADGFDMVAPTVVEEDRQMLREKFATLEKPGDSVSTEYRVQHKDGKLLHVLGNVKLIERDGEVLYQRFLLDNSDQKIKEQERGRRQQALLKALSDDYQVACSFNLETGDGELLRLANSVADNIKAIFNSRLNLVRTFGAYIGNFVASEDIDLFRNSIEPTALKKLLKETNRYDILYRKHEETGGEFYQVTIVRMGDDTDEIVIGLRNVDKQTREQLQAKQLLEEALERANRASEAKSTFLSNMSHDIRTPMNAITGFTTLAINHIDDMDKVQEYLGKISASSTHLLSLINDILDMSRIESGKISIEEQTVDLVNVVDNMANIMQPTIDSKGQKFIIDHSKITDTAVVCDKLKLDQILLNLIGNANKFTEVGGTIELIVSQLGRTDNNRAKYEFIIRDSGMGMSQDFLVHIFDPFERERTSTLSGIQGTGLGMAITKNLVTMMGGTISVQSEKGVGTEFTITFDFLLGDGTNEESNTAGDISDEHLSDVFKGCSVLLVDDNALNREIAVTLLEDVGFKVDTAVNGQDAVDILTNCADDAYQLVLMDIQMPVMNGYEAARCIRALDNPAISNLPILAVTADAFEEDKKKALDAGMNGHVAKPIDIKQLFITLDAMLASESTGQPA